MVGKRFRIFLLRKSPEILYNLAANAFNEGRTMVKTVPDSGEECTWMVPLCKLMIRLASASPSPKPSMGEALAVR